MKAKPYTRKQQPPPSFQEATNRRVKARTAGLDPDYWYVAAVVADMNPGDKKEILFWGRSLILWRDKQGDFHCMENRCAHRGVRLTDSGIVEGCRLVCQYHGWWYNGDGDVEEIWHETFGHDNPKFKIQSYPVQVKYGLVWIFPGDPERAGEVEIPEWPEMEAGSGWTIMPVEFVWNTHHSIVLENVSDYTHGYLHRKYEPFSDPTLVQCDSFDDSVHIAWNAKIGSGKLANLFIDRAEADSNLMKLGYDYPYNWSNTDDYIKHFICMLPESPTRTRFFFIFMFKAFKVPFTSLKVPRVLMKPLLAFGRRSTIMPVMAEDQMAVEWEMDGFTANWDQPAAELSPQVKAFQDLTIRKWQEYLDRVDGGAAGNQDKLSAVGG